MKIINRSMLDEHMEKFPDSKAPLNAWLNELIQSDWTKPSDIKQSYPRASILKGRRVIFRIGGNKYRLVVKFNYEKGLGYIRFIGTHKEYDKINAEEI